jgi:predicted regulator of Ras-like GTPase activity (Roadblock/LC7/MglB family)
MKTARALTRTIEAPIDVRLDPDHEAEIVVLPQRTIERSHTEMDEDIAASWGLWSEQIGRALSPVLKKLADSLPTFSSAMICTADGFNLCTLGVDESHVSRLSAMTSSMHSIAEAVSSSVHDGAGNRLDQVSLSNGNGTTVVLAVRDLIVGPLLIWVTATDLPLGVLLMRARVAAEGIRDVLADE